MIRKIIQWAVAIGTNANLSGFIEGRIYQGPLKNVCVPGLNCYSCPGALGSCPIGALQAVPGSILHTVSFYVIGVLMLFGILLGRFVCGFLCPFGLIQELIHKVPFPRIKQPWEKLRYLKYGILAVFVVLLPMVLVDSLGMSDPAFCKYVCPAGTLTGAFPLLAADEGMRTLVGPLFALKLGILIAVILGCLMVYRFFCKYMCPLGAIYSFFNKISLYQLRWYSEKCVHCGKCAKVCKMGVDPSVAPGSPECIRCGDCVRACPQGALHAGFTKAKDACGGSCKGCAGCAK